MFKSLGFVFLCFFVIAGSLYAATALNALVAKGQLSPPAFSPAGATSVNFNFFGKQNPTGKTYITQGYGTTPYAYLYKNHWHDGVDIAASYGATIYSPNTGTVLATGDMDAYCYHEGFGKYVAVEDPTNNLVLFYAHLGSMDVTPGETVAQGAAIGTVGTTGYETGVHLHFSVFQGNNFTMQVRDGCGPEPTGQDVNPLSYLGSTYK